MYKINITLLEPGTLLKLSSEGKYVQSINNDTLPKTLNMT